MMGLALAVVAGGRGPLVDTQSIALTNSMDEVVEIIDFAVSSVYPRRVADGDWDGSPTSSLDALIGLSFPGVAWATCSAANLRVKITSEAGDVDTYTVPAEAQLPHTIPVQVKRLWATGTTIAVANLRVGR